MIKILNIAFQWQYYVKNGNNYYKIVLLKYLKLVQGTELGSWDIMLMIMGVIMIKYQRGGDKCFFLEEIFNLHLKRFIVFNH
jgi:hypothetical protein